MRSVILANMIAHENISVSYTHSYLTILVNEHDLSVGNSFAYSTITLLSGWQYQQSPPTIQCIMEKALTRITKLEREDLHLVGAGRTDAGVHAWGQVRHYCANEV